MISIIFIVFAGEAGGLLSLRNFTVPCPIYLPNQVLSSPIILNPSTCDSVTDLTLSFATPVKISKGFVVSIEVFGHIQDFRLETDWNEMETVTLTFAGIQTASEVGIYYISLEVRLSDQGQIIAANQAFSAVFLSSKRPETKNFAFSMPSKFNWGETVSIIFELNLETLPKNGQISVYFDENFRIDKLSEFELESNQTSQNFSIIRDPDKNKLKILNADENSTQFVRIKIQAKVKSPQKIVDLAEVLVEIIDLQALKILEVFKAEKKIENLSKIQIKSWQPAFFDVDKVIKGLVRFMELVFYCEVDLPEAFSIKIEFESIDIRKYSYYQDSQQLLHEVAEVGNPYLFINFKSLLCEISSSSAISCKITSKIPAGSLIKIYTLTEFLGTESKVKSIIVASEDDSALAQTSESFIKKYSTELLLSVGVKMFIASDPINLLETHTNINSILAGYLYIDFLLPESTTDSDILTITSIFSFDSSQQTEKISLTSPIASKFSYSSDFSTSFSFDTPVELSEGSLKINLKPATVNAGERIYIMITSENIDNPKISLPLFPSSVNTRYETFFTYSSNSVSYIYSKPFTVVPQPLKTYQIDYFCSSLQYPNLITVIYASVQDLQPSKDLETFLEIWFSDGIPNDFGSGLTPGEEYPASDLNSNNFLSLANATNSGFSAGLRLNLSLGIESKDNKFTFPLFQATESKVYSVTFKFIAVKEKTSYEIFTSSILIDYYYHLIKITEEKKYYFIAEEFVNYLKISITQNLDSGTLALFFPEGFKLTGYEKIRFEPERDFESSFYISKSANLNINFILIKFPIYNWYRDLIISNFTAGKYLGKFTLNMAFLVESYGECSIFSEFISYVYRSPDLKILRINPNTCEAAGPESLESEFETELFLPSALNFTSNHQLQLSLNTAFQKVLQCDISSSFITMKTKILDNTCQVTTNETVLLKSVAIKFKLIPPFVYQDTKEQFYESLTVELGKFVLFSLNTSDQINLISFYKSNSPVISNVKYFKVFPDFISDDYSEMFLSFVPGVEIPANSLIQIEGISFLDDLKAFKNTWITGGFIESYVNSGTLNIKLFSALNKDAYVQIYKRNAFLFKTKGLFEILISISYNNIPLLKDSITLSNNKRVSINQNFPQNFTKVSVTKDILSVYESSFYEFSLQADFIITKSDLIVFDFSTNHSVITGNVYEKYLDQKKVFYLKTDDSETECFSLYWKLICRSFTSKNLNKELKFKFSLLNMKNPSSQNISVYILDSNYSIVYFQILKDLSIGSPLMQMLNIQLKSTNEKKPNNFDVVFSLMPNRNISINDFLTLSFPDEFQLSLYNPSITCNLTLGLNSSKSLNYQCLRYLNDIRVQFLSNLSLAEKDSISIELQNIAKPTQRFNFSQDFLSNGFDSWTNQVFCKLGSYQNKFTTSRTVSNLNQVFIGYNQSSYEKVHVDCQGRENLIILKLGTSVFCRLSITGFLLKARSLELIPSSELELDKSSYFLQTYEQSLSFRVKAPAYINPGTHFMAVD